jgi:arylsulfatase
MEKTLPTIVQCDESFEIGSDTLAGLKDVDDKPPLAFSGRLVKLIITVNRLQLSPADIEKRKAAERNNASSW